MTDKYLREVEETCKQHGAIFNELTPGPVEFIEDQARRIANLQAQLQLKVIREYGPQGPDMDQVPNLHHVVHERVETWLGTAAANVHGILRYRTAELKIILETSESAYLDDNTPCITVHFDETSMSDPVETWFAEPKEEF